MTITIRLKTDNDAFQPDPAVEIARLLKVLVLDLDCGGFVRRDWDGYQLRDSNGNTVGSVRVTGR